MLQFFPVGFHRLIRLLGYFLPMPFLGSSLLKQLFSAAILKTGVSDLDRLLSGGLYTGEVTEFCGQSLSGKTRICLHVVAETARAGKNVLYLDSSSGLSVHASVVADLLVSSRSKCEKDGAVASGLLDDYSDDDDNVIYAHVQNELERIRFMHVSDCFSLLKTLAKIEAGLTMARRTEEGGGDADGAVSSVFTQFQPSLIVIDSLATIMSPMLGGTEVTQGLSYLASVGRALKLFANSFNVAVMVTNHIVTPLQEGGCGVGGGGDDASEVARDRPAMGLAWAGFPHVRIKLTIIRKTKGDSRRKTKSEDQKEELKVHASLLKHSRLPCGKTKLFTL